ncbi:MAG: hypothetical protein Q8903_15365 [Bacteroidota bacterium]|nr:hypothetical protein [Bacteroidota bacterium]
MQNKIILSFILLLSFTCDILLSQVNDKTSYIIISFEMKRSKDPKGTQKFYWITPTDSIKRTDFYLFPLYLSEYSKDKLEKCGKGDTIDVFTHTTATNYNFDKGYPEAIDSSILLLDKKKIKVQTITIEWTKEFKEDINVYATPITGKFCNCLQRHLTGKKVDFKGLVFIPLSGFSFDDNFWKSDQSKKVMFANYASVDFSSHLLLYGKSVRTKLE